MTRLIDADALIDDLKHDVDLDQDSLDYEELTDSNREMIQFDKDCKQNAIDLLQNAPTIEPQRWIPCSERLPEKNCRCLTTNEAWGSFEVDWNAWIDGQWLYPNEKPIAWMPLPPSYQGEEKAERKEE